MPVNRPGPRGRLAGLLRPFVWGGLGAWALWLGFVFITRSARAAPQPGEHLDVAQVTGRTVSGAPVRLLAGDSAVAVLAATAECSACRLGLPAYREIAAVLRSEGVAFRTVVGSDSLATHRFARLLPAPEAVLWDPQQKLLRTLGVGGVPSLYVLDRDGRVLRTWAPLPGDERIAPVVAAEVRAARRAAR